MRATDHRQRACLWYPNLVEGLEVTRPEQVWVADIAPIPLRKEVAYL